MTSPAHQAAQRNPEPAPARSRQTRAAREAVDRRRASHPGRSGPVTGNQSTQGLFAPVIRTGGKRAGYERNDDVPGLGEMPSPTSIAPRGDRTEQAADAVADCVAGPQWSSTSDSPTPMVVGPSGLGPGRPLDRSTQSRFEGALGTDLSTVRVHDDACAHAAAAQVNAAAFSVSNHIVFARNEFVPNTSRGAWLLAHELTHVYQHAEQGQSATMHRAPLQRGGEPATDTDAARSESLLQRAFDAADEKNWEQAARLANGLSEYELRVYVQTLKDPELIYWLHAGALKAPGVGEGSAIALATEAAYQSVRTKEDERRQAREKAERARQNADAMTSAPTKPSFVTKEEQWQDAKAGARNWYLSKEESALVGLEFGLKGVALDMLLGTASSALRFVGHSVGAIDKARAVLHDTPAQRALASLRAPEPEEHPTNLREYLRKENYDAMQTTLTAAETGITAVAPMVAESWLAVRAPSGPVPEIFPPALAQEETGAAAGKGLAEAAPPKPLPWAANDNHVPEALPLTDVNGSLAGEATAANTNDLPENVVQMQPRPQIAEASAEEPIQLARTGTHNDQLPVAAGTSSPRTPSNGVGKSSQQAPLAATLRPTRPAGPPNTLEAPRLTTPTSLPAAPGPEPPTPAVVPSVPAGPSPSPRVWVNTKSGVYHAEGSKFFGATKQGRYMTSAEADAAGYRAAKPSNLDAARLGTAEHARMTNELRQFEGIKLDNGWEMRKVERTVGGTKRIDQLWVHEADQKVTVTDYFTGRAEPASHYTKGMNYRFEPEVQELLAKGYKYEYQPVVMPGGKP